MAKEKNKRSSKLETAYLALVVPNGTTITQDSLLIFTAAGMAQFAQSLSFDLTNAFSGYAKFLPHFFQSPSATIIKAEPELQYFFVLWAEAYRVHRRAALLTKQRMPFQPGAEHLRLR